MTDRQRSDVIKTSALTAGVHLGLICVLSFVALLIFHTSGHAALFWPANGVILALLLRTGPQRLLPVLLLSYAANTAGVLAGGAAPAHAFFGSACNVGEAALASLVLNRVIGSAPDLTRFRDLMIFAALAVMVPVVSGSVATGLLVGVASPTAADFLRGWWLANSLGLLIVTPVAMTVRLSAPGPVAKVRPAWMMPAALAAVLAVAATDALIPVGAMSIGGLAVLALVGAEYGGAFAAGALLVVSSAVIAGNLAGGTLANIPAVQAWLAAQSLVILALTSLMAEQRRLQAELGRRLRQSEAERLAIADSDRLARLAGAVGEIGYWRTDFTTGETIWSEAMLGILGLPMDGSRARMNILTAIQTCVVQADQSEMFRLSEALRRDGEAWATQVRVIRQSDGAFRLLSLRGEPERSPDGAVTGVLCVGRDITAEADARAALEESEARYRVLAEASPDLVIRCDLDFRLEYASPKLADYGYEVEAVIGQPIRNMIHPADRTNVENRIRDGLARGGMDLAEDRTHRLLTASGDTVWVESRPSIIRSATGEPVAILAQVRDVTGQRAQRKALEASELRYRTIAERVTDIIAVTGADGVFRYLSPAIEGATGYPPELLIGQLWSEHLHPDDQVIVTQGYRALARGDADAAKAFRYRARRRDGSWVWLESRPVPQWTEDGQSDGFIDVVRDVSRSVELETDLRAAKEAAERAALAKSEFLANMSHEIRTPLTAVLGFVGVVSDRQDLSPDTRLDLERIDHAGRTLLSIVNDILEVSKLEAGQAKIEPVPCDIRRLTADLTDMFAPQAAARDLSLTLHVADTVPEAVRLDGDRVRQVAVNLIGNALKFTDTGAVGVEVAYDPAGERLRVRVRDTGPGLDALQTAGLFQRFAQVDTSVTRRQGGTGLGLAICRGLVEAMGGEIAVDSTPGAGACFHFEIPAPGCTPLVREAIVQPDFTGVSLLVVDDNASNRDLAARIFVNLGFRVDVAASGLEGVAACAQASYDLILMDIRMPEVDGPTAARMIREGNGTNSSCPILAFTADVDAGLDQRFPGRFDGMVRKPIELAQLIEEVAACLPVVRGAVPATTR